MTTTETKTKTETETETKTKTETKTETKLACLGCPQTFVGAIPPDKFDPENSPDDVGVTTTLLRDGTWERYEAHLCGRCRRRFFHPAPPKPSA